MTRLTRDFYARPTLEVARDLLGRHLVRVIGGVELAVRVVETEAYCGVDDTACHASKGRTRRTEVMFGPPGHAYVYFTYGMHWLLNAVTEPAGSGCAVLLRAVEPIRGADVIRANRPGRRERELTSGPARLTKALRIDGALDACDLVGGDGLFLTEGAPFPDAEITASPRVGIGYAAPPHRDAPWRFHVTGNPHVSRAR